jgi:hypothetical protein
MLPITKSFSSNRTYFISFLVGLTTFAFYSSGATLDSPGFDVASLAYALDSSVAATLLFNWLSFPLILKF